MDEILMMGDMAEYEETFGIATLMGSRKKPLIATGTAMVLGRLMAVEGDQQSATLENVSYTAGSFVIPGTGTLRITKLNKDQKAKTELVGRKILVKGTKYDAVFEVDTPAAMPQPPLPNLDDPTPSYKGKGKFIALNKEVKDQS